MKRLVTHFFPCCFLILLLTACAAPAATPTPAPAATAVPPTPSPAPADPLSNLHWFGMSAFLYGGSQNIYFDPFTLPDELPAADIILITHSHAEHFSVSDLKKIIGPQTTLVISPNTTGVYEAARDELGIPATVLPVGETLEINGVSIQAVPAFDTHAHLKANEGAGYIVTVDGQRLYQAGATIPYPEMEQYECDIAMLPLYRMEEVKEMIQLVPAEVFVIEHTTYSTVQAIAKQLAGELPTGTVMADLKPGPLTP